MPLFATIKLADVDLNARGEALNHHLAKSGTPESSPLRLRRMVLEGICAGLRAQMGELGSRTFEGAGSIALTLEAEQADMLLEYCEAYGGMVTGLCEDMRAFIEQRLAKPKQTPTPQERVA